MTRHDTFLDQIDRDARGRLPGRRRAALHDHLRACEACRAHHDRVALAFGVLEGEPLVSRFELEQAERWIVDTLPADTAPVFDWRGWMLPMLGLAAVLLLAAVGLRRTTEIAPNGLPGGDDDVMTLTARGGDTPSVCALTLYCGATPTHLHPALPGGCGLDETLAFAYRQTRADATGFLSLFGADDAAPGEVRYYAPTPVDAAALQVQAGQWEAAPVSIRLSVNHQAGETRLYALFTATAPTTAQIDEVAAALAASAPDDAAPWHTRIHSPALDMLCPGDTCQSATTLLRIHPESK